jgi:tetratricopeptide (TPR) repeat protein
VGSQELRHFMGRDFSRAPCVCLTTAPDDIAFLISLDSSEAYGLLVSSTLNINELRFGNPDANAFYLLKYIITNGLLNENDSLFQKIPSEVADPQPLATARLPGTDQIDVSSELRQCRNSPNYLDKIAHCSIVVAHSRNRTALEVAFNSRGFAFMEAERFIDAANDFSEVIKLDSSVAGYYDNRQNAFRRAGRLQDALNDANRAIQIAPTYSFV